MLINDSLSHQAFHRLTSGVRRVLVSIDLPLFGMMNTIQTCSVTYRGDNSQIALFPDPDPFLLCAKRGSLMSCYFSGDIYNPIF